MSDIRTPQEIARDRKALLGKVHIAKKSLAMEGDSYRALLRRVAGADSAAQCSEAGLIAIVNEFKRLGFVAPKRKGGRPQVQMIYALWRELRPYLVNPEPDALRIFVRRQTSVTAPEWLDAQQANVVIEGLKGWLAREKAKEAVL